MLMYMLNIYINIEADSVEFGTVVSKSGSIGTVSGRLWVPKAEFL